MKINLPVTDREIRLTDETLIVSKTDLNGIITYVNKDFIDISGFTASELIGEPHNLVRHPDMPVEAFKDLWETLKAGRPWTGHVKNRTKNGDYYWVLANATPLWESSQITGYLSVRRKASQAAIDAHESAYKLFREQRQGRLVICQGQAVKGLQWRKNLGIGARVGGLLGMLGALVVVMSLLSLLALSRTNEATVQLYNERFQGVSLLGRISQLMAENRMQIALSGIGVDPDPTVSSADHGRHMTVLRERAAEISHLWGAYQKTVQSDEHRQLAEDYTAIQRRFIAEGLLPAAEAIDKGDNGKAWQLFTEQVDPAFRLAIVQAEKLREYHVQHGQQEMNDSQERFATTRNGQSAMLAMLFVLGLGLSLWLVRAIRRDLRGAIEVLRHIGQGDYSQAIDITRDDEIGKLQQGLQSMQTRAGFEMAETQRVAVATSRVVSALNSVTMPVTVSNDHNQLIYMNQAARALWGIMAPAIAVRHPGFSIDGMMGGGLARYFEDEASRQTFLQVLDAPRNLDIRVAERDLSLTVAPVRDDAGHYLGRVTQWVDRTAELAVEREVEAIVSAAAHGDFAQRLTLDDKTGFFLKLTTGLNRLLDMTAQGLADVARVLNALAQGNLTQSIEVDYQGALGQLKDDTNATVQRLREVVTSIKESSESIDTAAKEIAAGNQDLSSRTEEQASSLEETASSMEELNATVRNNAENARQANALARTSNDVARRGGDMVGKVVATMDDIQRSSAKIADIVGVIDSIAFQTNILALNAAVEAARAGDAGRGFAVVASEVRNLAQRSATAAKEIKTLIGESLTKVEGGAQLVRDAGQTMSEVVDSFQRVASLVTQISNASDEQSHGIEQVTHAVGQMDEVTQQNAALVEEAAAAAESLEEQAQGLVRTVGVFKLNSVQSQGKNFLGPVLRSFTPRQLSAPTSEGKQGIPGLDFDAVLRAHMAWKSKLREFMAGQGEKLDPAIVGRDDKCGLGGWIYGDGSQFSGNADFEALRTTHAEFHQCAAQVVQLHLRGDKRGAIHALGGQFGVLTAKTVNLIQRLRVKSRT